MILRFKNTKISNKHELISLYQSSSHILLTSLFFWEKCTLPYFLENNKSLIPSPLKHWGDPAMINQKYLLHIFVSTKEASNNKNI